jgi:hypothetical protein
MQATRNESGQCPPTIIDIRNLSGAGAETNVVGTRNFTTSAMPVLQKKNRRKAAA